MAVELKIPTAGESITEVQIGAWSKSVGDYVEADEEIVEIETDKASMELPAPASGTISKILVEEGEIAKVGQVIALIEEGEKPAGKGEAKQEVGAASGGDTTSEAKAGTATATDAGQGGGEAGNGDGDALVMPAARRLLEEKGLRAADVPATGPGGRLLKEDVLRYIEQGGSAAAPQPSTKPQQPEVAIEPPAEAPGDGGPREEQVVPMTMLRRRIAQRLVEAQQTAAMLTTFNEIDMSNVMAVRAQHKDAFERKYGIRLGFMSFFVKAAVDALKRIPEVNAEIRGDYVVYKNFYDVGVAVSTDKGLVVPVIRGAERLSFAEVEKKINELATRARDRKLSIEELQGGTFTITNGGVFGSLMATPIINPPQSAILGLHAIKDRPIAVDGEVVIRPMMYVALTYDHRIIDGKESVTFLKRIKECIEDPARMLIEI